MSNLQTSLTRKISGIRKIGLRTTVATLSSVLLLTWSVGISTAAHAAAPTVAPPVKLAGGPPPPIGGAAYEIQNNYYDTWLQSMGGNQRMVLSLCGQPDSCAFYQTSSAPYSYEGHLWYQWELATGDGYCLAASGNGAAHLIMAVCNGTDKKQFFYNNSLNNSKFLNLESSVFEDTDYGVWAENAGSQAINSYSSESTYAQWNFADVD